MDTKDLLDAAYQYLRDEGGFYGSLVGGIIAGMLTLAGGYLAYRAGAKQAEATLRAASDQVAAIRRAASDQVSAIQAQMAQEVALLTDRERRATKSLLLALSGEASRANMEAQQRQAVYSRMRPDARSNEIVNREVARTLVIEPDGVVWARLSADTNLADTVRRTANELFIRLDQLNVQLRIKAPFGEMHDSDVRSALSLIVSAAQQLEETTALALNL